jgi:hypothetical protein
MDPDKALEFAVKFAKKYLGDYYEAVVAVHDNTEHVHAHIVFNSVSFVTGLKYHYKKGDWEKNILPITNELCGEYGISKIDLSGRASEDVPESMWDEHKNGPFVWSGMIKRDIDNSIIKSESFEEFETLMREKGYEIKTGKYFAVKPRGMNKFRRVKMLGEDYTEERIRERIKIENIRTVKLEDFDTAERLVLMKIPRVKKAKLTGLQKDYYRKLYELGMIERRPYSNAYKYKNDIRLMKKLQEQYLFLCDHDITSETELSEAKELLITEAETIAVEKSRLYRAKKKCEELIDIANEMQQYEAGETAYKRGNEIFLEDHLAWSRLNAALTDQGYSFDLVKELDAHYKAEISRVSKLKREKNKDIKLAESVTKELERERELRREEENKNKDKRHVRSLPGR